MATDAEVRRFRRLIGDTDSTDYLLQEEDVTDYITDYGNVFTAAAAACNDLAARFAREVDVSIDSGAITAKNGDLMKHYKDLADAIRVQAITTGGDFTPYAGGIVKTESETNQANTAINQPSFRRNVENDYVAPRRNC